MQAKTRVSSYKSDMANERYLDLIAIIIYILTVSQTRGVISGSGGKSCNKSIKDKIYKILWRSYKLGHLSIEKVQINPDFKAANINVPSQ